MGDINEKDEFVSLDDLLTDQNKKKHEYELYQVISDKNCKFAKLMYVGKYENIPTTSILKFTFDKYECELLSLLITKEEAENNKSMLMISLLIFDDKKIVASIDLTFERKNMDELPYLDNGKKSYITNGMFKIMFKKNGCSILLKEFNEYLGREESIHEMVEIISDDKVIEQLF